MTPEELIRGARDAIGYRIGWAALENDGEAVDLFVNFVDAADKLLAWHERKHPEETPT